MAETTAPQVLPSNDAALLTKKPHCCGEVSVGTSLAATALQSNGSLGFRKVCRVNVLASPDPAVTGFQDSVMLPRSPGGSVPNGPVGLYAKSCSDGREKSVAPGAWNSAFCPP